MSPTTVPENGATDDAEVPARGRRAAAALPPEAVTLAAHATGEGCRPRAPGGAKRAEPSGLCRIGTPRTRKSDAGAAAEGVATPYQVEGAGGPMGPGRFERWGRGRGPPSSSCAASSNASPRGSRAERGRLPIAPPAAAPPAAADYESVAEESRRLLATAAAAAGVGARAAAARDAGGPERGEHLPVEARSGWR